LTELINKILYERRLSSMKKRSYCALYLIALMVLSGLLTSGLQAAESPQREKAQQEQTAPVGLEISTEELKEILMAGKIPVIDVRPQKEYGISHIPGSINIFETEIERMMELCPDKASGPVLYCNGPYCHKTSRVAEKLFKKGCTNVKKYQHGLPLWRAFGNTAETSLSGVQYVFSSDKTAVFVDARTLEEYSAGTVPGAVNLQASEIEAANQDGRLPYTDHGTRIIVFGKSINQARELAQAIAPRAYWNSSYFAGTFEDLIKAGLW
jgi:rhodanese-related sulfurtransferase